MNFSNTISIIGILIILIFLSFLIKYFFPSYFQQKGQNIATKEDVSEITTLVEKAKHTFTTETEKIKSTLLTIANIQMGIISEERNSIIDLNEKYFKWLHILTDTNLTNIDEKSNIELEKHYHKISQLYNDLLISEARFYLFIDNNEFTDSYSKMKIETMNHLTNQITNYILNLKKINNETEFMYKTTPLEKQNEEFSVLLNKKKEIYINFSQEVIKGYKIIVPINRSFQKHCRQHIYSTIKEKNINQII